jgi:hypothetical protein
MEICGAPEGPEKVLVQIFVCVCMYIQGVSGEIINILGGDSMDCS